MPDPLTHFRTTMVLLVTSLACTVWTAVAQPLQTTSLDARWVLESPPGARHGHTAVFAPPLGRTLVFGGFNGSYLNDVWTLDANGAWARLTPQGTPPSGRTGHSAIWDATRSRMIVFGGTTGGSNYLNDTYALDFSGQAGPTWTNLGTGAPAPRAQHAAVFDPVNGRMLVVMGTNGSGFFTDVWSFTLANNGWTNVSPQTIPPGRCEHAAVYDPTRNRMIVWGGRSGLGVLSDAWIMDGGWSVLSPAGPPPSARYGTSAYYDGANDRMVVFGGTNNSTFFQETWALTFSGGPAWAPITTSGTPPPGRTAQAAVFDPSSDRMVVFGGRDAGSVFDDVVALSFSGGAQWSTVVGGDVPSPRSGQSAVFDAPRQRMLVFGGTNGTDFYGDVAAYSWTGNAVWTSLAPAGTPPSARASHSAIFDPVRDRMVVFGGFNGSNLSDTWALSLSGSPAWSPITTAGAKPTMRTGPAALYDPVRDRMLVFGGRTGATYMADVWALSLGESPAWSQLTPTGSPPAARAFHSMTYDPVRDEVIVFGGLGETGPFADTWRMSFASGPAWAPVSSPSPAARYSHTTIHDPIGDRIFMFGGRNVSSMFNDLWELSLEPGSSWTPRAPDGASPSVRNAHSAIYDGTLDRMVVFGGRGFTGNQHETWSLMLDLRVGVEPPTPPARSWLAAPRPNPSRGAVELTYALPKASRATLVIHDLSGRVMRTLVNGALPAGTGNVRWDGRTSSGAIAPPGVYFSELRVEGQRLARRLVLIP